MNVPNKVLQLVHISRQGSVPKFYTSTICLRFIPLNLSYGFILSENKRKSSNIMTHNINNAVCIYNANKEHISFAVIYVLY